MNNRPLVNLALNKIIAHADVLLSWDQRRKNEERNSGLTTVEWEALYQIKTLASDALL